MNEKFSIGQTSYQHGFVELYSDRLLSRVYIRQRAIICCILDDSRTSLLTASVFVYHGGKKRFLPLTTGKYGRIPTEIAKLRDQGFRVLLCFATRYPIHMNPAIFKQNLIDPPIYSHSNCWLPPVEAVSPNFLIEKNGEYIVFDSVNKSEAQINRSELEDARIGHYLTVSNIVCNASIHMSGVYCSYVRRCVDEYCLCRGFGYVGTCPQCNRYLHNCPFGCGVVFQQRKKQPKEFYKQSLTTVIKKTRNHLQPQTHPRSSLALYREFTDKEFRIEDHPTTAEFIISIVVPFLESLQKSDDTEDIINGN